ncbi:MAG: hypothetical protein IJ551_07555 [Prevotella sp.]|nr:hypothetical protein [Prevotella sp.]MBQ8948283.1 hypothetical protein [Prevotella sp.]
MEKKLYMMPEIQAVKLQGDSVMTSQSFGGTDQHPGQAGPNDTPSEPWTPEDGGDSRRGGGFFDED